MHKTHSISNGLRQGLVQTSVNYRFTNADIGFVLFFEWGTLPIWVREMEKENSKPTKDVDVW